jgi:CheY-like chemotaxis protein
MPLSADCIPKAPGEMGEMYGASIEVRGKSNTSSLDATNGFGNRSSSKAMHRNSISSLSMTMGKSGSQSSAASRSQESSRSDSVQYKARITMFPEFAAKLDNLKTVAQEMMDNELDPVQQDVIAQQFAEASLTILRQLRYHCMESGLDGWRQGKLRRKVLIVDDSVVTRKMVARAFEKANFIVDTAENGVEGVNKMKESIYDIAFMDIDMPVMNGFDATKALRMWEDSVRPGARQPICALTAAHVDDFDREELMKFKDAGLDVMESKPCNIPRLFKVVDDVSPMFSDLRIIQESDESHFEMAT